MNKPTRYITAERRAEMGRRSRGHKANKEAQSRRAKKLWASRIEQAKIDELKKTNPLCTEQQHVPKIIKVASMPYPKI